LPYKGYLYNNVIERVVQSLKDRTEGFDDYYPCVKEECELEHVYKWTRLFVFMHNVVRAHIKFSLLTHLIGGDIRKLNTSTKYFAIFIYFQGQSVESHYGLRKISILVLIVLFISWMAFGISSITSANVQALISTSPSKYAALTSSTIQRHTQGSQLHKNIAQQIVIGRQEILHTQTDLYSNTVTLARIDSLWSHVYDSKRLAVQKPCITITGKVEDNPRHEPDGDTHFILTLDPKYTGYSRDNNCKPAALNCNLLIVELICHNPIAQSYQKKRWGGVWYL
jgi:hypothetical protein